MMVFIISHRIALTIPIQIFNKIASAASGFVIRAYQPLGEFISI